MPRSAPTPASPPPESAPPSASARGASRLEAKGLRKRYRGKAVVDGVSLSLGTGEAVGLLGPNGAGKTTCFHMIAGLAKPDEGRIEIDGFDLSSLPMHRRARLGIGYLPQESSIFRGLSVEGNIRAVLEIAEPVRSEREAKLDLLLREFGIEGLRKSPAASLSGGERRRCEIARALAAEPTFILFDEPFAGIDPIASGDIRALVGQLKRRGIGALVTDHNVRETLGIVDRAYIIAQGRLIAHGTPDEILENPEARRTYLGEEFAL